jgi:peptidoglycan/xylan/chitin deacetylase (PgdA/CDA1 family)
MFIRNKAQGLRRRLYTRWFDALGDRGLSAWYANRFAGVGVIFMYHRVIDPRETTLEPGYAVSTSVLESCLEMVRRAGWAIVSLDTMRAALLSGDRERRLACFTFDDGYADNYTLALPIFRKYGAPFCVYVSTAIVDRTMFYWWGALERLVLKNDQLEIDIPDNPLGSPRVTADTLAAKRRLYQAIDVWTHAHPAIAAEELRRLFHRHGVDDRAMLDQDALSVDQLRRFAADPLVTIGSHGVTHERLSGMSAAALASELGVSRQRLEEAACAPVQHLSYPFGGRNSCGPREFDAAARSGYLTAVTTRRGNIFPTHRDHLFALPRRESSPHPSDTRYALYGVSSILRRDPVMVTD